MLSRKDILINKTKGKQLINEYLNEISSLVKKPISKEDLISLEDTFIKIEETKRNVAAVPVGKTRFHFDDKDKLKNIFSEINRFYDGGFYLVITYSKYCGAAYLESLEYFNTDFQFNDEHAGIISLLCETLNAKILLDFYEDASEKLLEVETYGVPFESVKLY
ncbi:MAG TPA: hypothetical protein VIN08_15755 [Ohtaekwangia sp.]|uniref:hypothetical protein n=1 Tax=Ohtaekwangia sp. TaxID=2066019 RepID=UPI002F95EBC0